MGLVRFVPVQKHDPELFKSLSNESLEICFCFSALLRGQNSVQKRKRYHCFCFRKTLRSGLSTKQLPSGVIAIFYTVGGRYRTDTYCTVLYFHTRTVQ